MDSKGDDAMAESGGTDGPSSDIQSDGSSVISKDFVPGMKIEAKDFDGRWYPAKVIELDWHGTDVHIHFENWSRKFDEWISKDSMRLRHVLSASSSTPPRPKLKEADVKDNPVLTFEKGEKVLAMWSAYQKYPGTIQGVLSNREADWLPVLGSRLDGEIEPRQIAVKLWSCLDRYEVLFYDGFVKRLSAHKIAKADEKELSRMGPNLVTDIGTKEERREKKRKLNIPELFSMKKKKRPKVADASDGKPVKSRSKTKLVAVAEPSVEDVGATPAPVEVSPPQESTQVEPVARNKAVVDLLTKSLEVKYINGKEELWTKQAVKRTEGRTAGKLDIVFTSPLGKKFRSKADIMKHCDENGIIYSSQVFDFSARGRSKVKPAVVTPVQLKEAEPSTPKEDAPVVKKPKLEPVVTPVALLPVDITKPEDNRLFIGDVEVQEENGQLKCPGTNCSKLFRRENLLHMHVKHYHPELGKFLDHTPSVTELAYARTKGSLANTDTPPGVGGGRKSDVKQSAKVEGGATPERAQKRVAFATDTPTGKEGKKHNKATDTVTRPLSDVLDKKPEFEQPSAEPLEAATEPEAAPVPVELEPEASLPSCLPLDTLEDVEQLLPVSSVRKPKQPLGSLGKKYIKTKRSYFHRGVYGNRKRLKNQERRGGSKADKCPSSAWQSSSVAAPAAASCAPVGDSTRPSSQAPPPLRAGELTGKRQHNDSHWEDIAREETSVLLQELLTNAFYTKVAERALSHVLKRHSDQSEESKASRLRECRILLRDCLNKQQPRAEGENSAGPTRKQVTFKPAVAGKGKKRKWKQHRVKVNGFEGRDETSVECALAGVEASVETPVAVKSEKLEKLRRHEMINCTCGIMEEDGLMIQVGGILKYMECQCDLCLCWQHSHCASILKEDDVPEKYVCSTCRNPFRGRSSSKYAHDQSWLKDGTIPRLSFSQSRSTNNQSDLLKRSHDLTDSLVLLTEYIRSTAVKLSIARQKDHPKLWMWNKWTNKTKTETTAGVSCDAEEDAAGSRRELERQLPKVPEPEKPIDPVECRLNLIEHIQATQNAVEGRLSSIESCIAALEAMTEDLEGGEVDGNCPKTKATMIMLLRDLVTFTKIGDLP